MTEIYPAENNYGKYFLYSESCVYWPMIKCNHKLKNIHLAYFNLYGNFENGIPVHDTIARVVSNISHNKFYEYFTHWMKECHTVDEDVIAIDGKRCVDLMIKVDDVERYMSSAHFL